MKTKSLLLWLLLLMGALSAQAQEAYAVLSSDKLTLWFFCDGRKLDRTREGTVYELNTGESIPRWYGYSDNITRVVFDSSFAQARPTSCYEWFSGCEKLTSITGLNNLNTSEVTTMAYMFGSCSGLTGLDLSSFNTAKVTDMQGMFYDCEALEYIFYGYMNTANVTNMSGMFNGCKKLNSVDLRNFNTAKVTNMSSMFHYCYSLTSLDLSNFRTANVTNMRDMFSSCRSLSSLNVSSFNTANVTNMSGMFEGCANLSNLDVSSFSTGKVTGMQGMFEGCESLSSINLSSFNTFSVTSMERMFAGCSNLTSLDVNHFNTTSLTDMDKMFWDCSSLTRLDVSNFIIPNPTNMLFTGCSALKSLTIPSTASRLVIEDDTYYYDACEGVGTQSSPCVLFYPSDLTITPDQTGSGWYKWKGGYFKDGPKAYAVLSNNNTTLTFYYDEQKSSRTGEVFDMNTGSNNPGWFDYRTQVTRVVFDPSFADARPTSCRSWFVMVNLGSFTGLEYLNTSEVTDMAQMFMGCPLESIDVSHFNTSKVRAMGGMFILCKNLKSINLKSFDTRNVDDQYTGFVSMFSNCTSLSSADLSSFTFSSDANSSGVFYNCSALKSLVLPSTANNLDPNAFATVGSQSSPCALIYPDDLTITPDETGSGWYKWKGGYFKESGKKAYYALEYFDEEETGYYLSCAFTFYYDDKRAFRGDTRPVTQNGQPLDFSLGKSVKYNINFRFDSSFADFRPTNTSYWFYQQDFYKNGSFGVLNFSGLQNLNTSEVTDMSHMFDGLTSSGVFTEDKGDYLGIDVTHFDTRKVTNMDYMFANMNVFIDINLDLSSFTINTNCSTNGMMQKSPDRNNNITCLTIPATGNNLAANACSGMGSSEAPIELVCPDGFAPQGATLYSGYFTWKGGYFKQATAMAYIRASYSPYYSISLRYDKGFSSGDVLVPDNGNNDKAMYTAEEGFGYMFTFESSFANYRPTNTSNWFRGMGYIYGAGSEFFLEGMENLNTSEVTNMSYMFYRSAYGDCQNDAEVVLDLSHFDTSKVTDMSYMFAGFTKYRDVVYDGENEEYTYSLGTLDISSFTINSSTNTNYMFKDAKIGTLIVPASANKLASNAFEGVGSSTKPCILFCPEGVTPQGATQYSGYFTWKGGYFKDPEPYAVLDGSTLTFYYDKKSGYRHGTKFDMNTGSNTPGWYANCTTVTNVVFDPSFANARPTSCYYWFGGMSNLATITDIKYLKTDAVTNMGSMFRDCSKLTSLDVSGFRTAKVTDMQSMFYRCSNLVSLDLSSFDTSNVTIMASMFRECSKLESLALRNFTTASATIIGSMFRDCSNLVSLDLSSFTFSSSAISSSFFYNCSALKSLILPSSANNLAPTALATVGTQSSPCMLIYPSDLTITPDDTGSGWYKWKGGYFKDGLKGDVNIDGAVTIADVMMTVSHIVGTIQNGFVKPNADVNGDKDINVSDVMTIVQMVIN